HDPISMYLTDVMTVATNLVGNCAISIPSGKDSAGLPIGFQLIGPQKGENALLSAAAALEAQLGKLELPV
ncbi:MAG TPA: amidase family protein, partial [Candidatus Nanoarchaeia archaeon]|nr:amidase family protein [Candidatus Nanoarchaeia archaeon]